MTDKKCEIEGIENGQLKILKGSNLKNVIYYHCNPEFILFGNAIRTCLNSGEWSGVKPECRGIYHEKINGLTDRQKNRETGKLIDRRTKRQA